LRVREREEPVVAFPKVVKVRQKFPRPRVEDIEAALREQLEREEIAGARQARHERRAHRR
jgi:hypothetical protein